MLIKFFGGLVKMVKIPLNGSGEHYIVLIGGCLCAAALIYSGHAQEGYDLMLVLLGYGMGVVKTKTVDAR
jgi:hypothetical protein